MVLASGTNVGLSYVEEVTRGTTPGGPSMLTLRATSRNVNLEKNILVSEEVRPTRQRATVRHGFNRVAGSPGFQLGLTDYDDIIRIAMGGTWASGVSASSIAIDGTGTGTSKFTRAAGSFVSDGFRPGMVITGSGFTDPQANADHLVLSVSAGELVVYDPTDALGTEASGGGKSVVMKGQKIDIGTNLKTITLERFFTDVALYQVFRGVTVDQLNWTVSPERIVNCTTSLIGMSAAVPSGSSLGAPAAASSNDPFAAFEGYIFYGSTLLGVATSFSLGLNNQRRLEAVIGSKYSPDVFNGTAILTGSLSFMLENATFLSQFDNETEFSLFLKFADVAGTGFHNLILHRVKLTGAPIDPGQEGPVIVAGSFEALENVTYGSALTYQKSNV